MKYKRLNVFTPEAFPNCFLVNANYDINLLRSIKPNQRITYDLKCPKFRLHRSLKYLPDFISSVILNPGMLQCSDKMLSELDFFKLPEYSAFDMEVYFDSKFHHFNLVHFPFTSNEMIDFPNSEFKYTKQSSLYTDPSKDKWYPIKISSYDEHTRIYEQYITKCTKLAIKEDTPLDFGRVSLKGGINGFYISDRMSDYLRDREIKGFRLEDL